MVEHELHPVRRRISGDQTMQLNDMKNDNGNPENKIDELSLYRNFCYYAVLFGMNHATGLACLPLATARLGPNLGSNQTALLYLFYTASACLGATVLVQSVGSKTATVIGMGLFCCYVGCFVVAMLYKDWFIIVYLGAALGGVGAGVAWTAQGVFYAETAVVLRSDGTHLASIFACSILVQETVLEALSTLLGNVWTILFGLYFAVAILSTCAMQWCVFSPPSSSSPPTRNKLLAALTLLRDDPSMRCMIPFHVSYSLSGAFLNSFLNGQVVRLVFANDSYVGILTALHGIVAAIAAAWFGKLHNRKIPILIFGSICFALVALPSLLLPKFETWNPMVLISAYVLQGIGRSTSEGTLKALFVDLFAYEKEGAFANIILQYGLASSVAYVLSNKLPCSSTESDYCTIYKDGSHHDILAFSLIVLVFGILSVFCLVLVRPNLAKEHPSDTVRRRSSLEMLTISRAIGEYQTIHRKEEDSAVS